MVAMTAGPIHPCPNMPASIDKKRPRPPRKSRIAGQLSWQLASDRVEAHLTELGGHLGPVRFHLGHRTVEPFSIAPWAAEKPSPATPAMLRVLRGDFFCAPFGGNDTPHRNEKHPPHGESANGKWHWTGREVSGEGTTDSFVLATRIRKGRILKSIGLRRGETNLYCRHVFTGMEGPMSFGHHAMLKFPPTPGSGTVTTSPVLYGQVAPLPFEEPARRGYQSFRPGGRFTRLDRVPLLNGGTTDAGSYPARQGFEDLLMLVHQSHADFAWSAAAFPAEGYAWFCLKDPRVLRSTILWISNGGRHYPPWNGRHLAVMGIEEVTSYFHYGLAESVRRNPVNRRGFPTSLQLDSRKPLTVNTIMGVVKIPRNFSSVCSIQRRKEGVVLVSREGIQVRTRVDTGFLYEKNRNP